jgi:hypothetical protein
VPHRRIRSDDASPHLLAEPPAHCVCHRVDGLGAGRCIVRASIDPW